MKILIAVAAGLLATATAAFALGEPIAYGEAEQGSFRLVAGVVVDTKLVELKGTWLDESVSCTAKRKLTVEAALTYSPPSGPAKSVTRKGNFTSMNCAEGGPNVGYTLRPASVKAKCPSGAWKPGQYAFNTGVTDIAKKLTAKASLLWLVDKRC